MAACMRCGRPLSCNEIGLHKRLINRGAKEYMCKACLAEHFQVSTELLDEKMKMYILQGCTLFSENGNEEPVNGVLD